MNLGFIGTGNIVSDVITGISKSKFSYKKIIISPRNKKKAQFLKKKFKKIIIAKNNQEVINMSRSDLLPADIVGVGVYRSATESFHFQSGPIFSEVVLADELNRATPKAQSALLEAMEEHQVTVDGESHVLPKPFFVIATQNPIINENRDHKERWD